MDPDDIVAQAWQRTPIPNEQRDLLTENSECDDYWFIPTYVEKRVLDEQLQTIGENSATYLLYNKEQEQKQQKQKATRTKGWAKPDRELTEAEKRKKARQEEREKEQQRYLGKPNMQCLFVHRIKWPMERSPLDWLGPNLRLLDPVRADCSAFIWLENGGGIWVAGDEKQSTCKAMNRIKNFIIKITKMTSNDVCHILEKPSSLIEIILEEKPPMPYISLPPQTTSSKPHEIDVPPVFLCAKEIAAFKNLWEYDLHMATEQDSPANQKDDHIQTLQYIERMTDQNIKRIRTALEDTLNNIQLWNGEIKMRIRSQKYGIMEMDQTVIGDRRLISEFSPYFTTSRDIYNTLERELNPFRHDEYPQEVEVHWCLGVLRRVGKDSINLQVYVTFREDGHVSLWNALFQEATPMDIRVTSSEKRFSWAWTISTARRADGDKFSPEGEFVHKLHLNKEKKLVFSNTTDIQLRYIHREEGTMIINDPWTTELLEECFWTLHLAHKPYEYMTLSATPDRVLYSVSMYRDSWKTRFSENPYLGIGLLPTWDSADFVEGEESIIRTMEAVDDIRAKMETSLY
ncbi:hypothetical protein BGZ65_006580 [Modicella reniformis]|uniref:DUF7905 domain-containing protein n=1 Tax=Modicella reniformis TaxID=1440133 RepID=A0A9P6MBD4_9FUNG|nr:hypothetical protein BGZ65_006580 [Modicella reniformis]